MAQGKTGRDILIAGSAGRNSVWSLQPLRSVVLHQWAARILVDFDSAYSITLFSVSSLVTLDLRRRRD